MSAGTSAGPVQTGIPVRFVNDLSRAGGEDVRYGMSVAGELVADPTGDHFRGPLPNGEDGADLFG